MSPNQLVPIRPAEDRKRPVQGSAARPLTVPGSDEAPVNWSRYLAAVRRFKWLILLGTIVGTGLGFGLSRLIAPEYRVEATIWISTESAQSRRSGPIRSDELLTNVAWPELIRSYAILDKVATKERLYLSLDRSADSSLFSGFTIAPSFRPGKYRFIVDSASSRYTLATAQGQQIEQGRTGTAIGAKLGFQWAPHPTELARDRTVDFTVRTPREAAVDLRRRLGVDPLGQSNLIQLSLSGSDPVHVASTINTVLDEFVSVAASLKKRTIVEFAATLGNQLSYAERELREAEVALQTFRVNTITLPSEGTALAGGLELTRDPLFGSFFAQKVEADNVQRDREMLATMLEEVRRGGLDVSALLAAPAARDAESLRTALREYATREAQLRTARVAFTDNHRSVRELTMALDTLRAFTIPRETELLISQLQQREQDLGVRIAASSRELRNIPTRSIEEMRLRRNVEVRENLYSTLKSRYEEARLADASSSPDVSILDRAVAPSTPASNSTPTVLLLATAGSFGLALALAVLLDRVDGRFRYPEQATGELGLEIIGAVPNASNASRGRVDPEQTAQLVEAFRTIRLNLQHACAVSHAAPITVTIASPGAGDGKSLVSANVALSFAEAGCRTLLIDGDVRRGRLHSAFGMTQRPGLVDYLAGEAVLGEVLRPSTHERLTIVTCGARRGRAPELLTSADLPTLIRMARAQFDAIVVDSAPLGAGVDAFVLGTVTENMVVVLRSGGTDRRLARAKLELADRLPINVVGAVLNDVPATGAYEYYSYLAGYSTEDGELAGGVPSNAQVS